MFPIIFAWVCSLVTGSYLLYQVWRTTSDTWGLHCSKTAALALAAVVTITAVPFIAFGVWFAGYEFGSVVVNAVNAFFP